MTYEEFIDSCRLKNPIQSQAHHIIPLSMGGTNHWSNIIRLSFADHWEAHRLLALKYPDNEEIQKNFRRKGTLEQFIEGCEKLAAQTGERNSQYGKAPTLGKHWKCSDIARENMSHGHIGKTHKGVHHTEETKNKISETQKRRYAEGLCSNNHTCKGRFWFTNGQNNVLDFTCPEGYWKGRTKCS